jgi:hypothetical protein
MATKMIQSNVNNKQAKQDFYDRIKAMLNDIWQLWLPTTRKVFIAVPLIKIRDTESVTKNTTY